jgi:hypothetical protein
MAFEMPITISEAKKIIGCSTKDIMDAISTGKVLQARGRNDRVRPKLDPWSFRQFCKDVYGITVERLPERRKRMNQDRPVLFSKKALKNKKRKCNGKWG